MTEKAFLQEAFFVAHRQNNPISLNINVLAQLRKIPHNITTTGKFLVF
jgi:hypothetical protein